MRIGRQRGIRLGFVAHVSIERKIFSGHVRKVIECPVLLGLANTSPESECMRNHGCRIFRITRKITQSEVQSSET